MNVPRSCKVHLCPANRSALLHRSFLQPFRYLPEKLFAPNIQRSGIPYKRNNVLFCLRVVDRIKSFAEKLLYVFQRKRRTCRDHSGVDQTLVQMRQIQGSATGKIKNKIIEVSAFDPVTPGPGKNGVNLAGKQRWHIIEIDLVRSREKTVFVLKARMLRWVDVDFKFDLYQFRIRDTCRIPSSSLPNPLDAPSLSSITITTTRRVISCMVL